MGGLDGYLVFLFVRMYAWFSLPMDIAGYYILSVVHGEPFCNPCGEFGFSLYYCTPELQTINLEGMEFIQKS
jgi:hypothetical protein